MLATVIICIVLGACLFLALRRIGKKGTCDCDSCDKAGCCPGSAKSGK